MKHPIYRTLFITAVIVAAVTALLGQTLLMASAEPHADNSHSEKHAGDVSRAEGDAHAGRGHAEEEDPNAFCKEHRMFEREDALCNPGLIGELQPGEGVKVRLAASDAAAKVGIATSKPQTMATATGVLLTGRSEFNRKRLAHLTALSGGVVRQVGGEVGQRVRRGELLAEIASPEGAAVRGQHGSAVARQAQTEATFEREKDLYAKGISSRLEFQQAEADLLAARSETEQLRAQLAGYGVAENGSASVRLRAPLAGVIVEKTVGIGDAVAPGTHLYTIADPESLWIELALPESRVGQARVGAAIEARFDGLPGRLFAGRIVSISAALDERSRTLKAVAEIKNPDGWLKAGMFGQVKLLTAGAAQQLVVPAAAVQRIDQGSFVFIQQESDLFEIRRVETGQQEAGLVPILFGLNAADEVVTTQGFALKSEVLKARLGASCADH